MPLSKKNKLILSWTLPPASVIVLGGVIASVFINNEIKNKSVINSHENIIPKSFSSLSNEQLNNLEYNPKNYDFNFFLWHIARNQKRVNSVFVFDGATLNADKSAWKKDGVSYSIDANTIQLEQSTGTSHTLKYNVLKEVGNIKTIYEARTNIGADLFSDSETSKTNFLNKSTKTINQLFSDGMIQINSNLPLAISTDEFQDESDVLINTNSESKLASSFFKPSNENKYITKNEEFLYGVNTWNQNSYINFSIPVRGKIFDSSDFILDDKGLIVNDSKIYKALKSELDSGNLTYLPELTTEESFGLAEPDIQKRKIQKLIFDPLKTPYNIVNNHKIPLSSLQAVLVSVELNNKKTWIVAWTNLLSISEELIKRAPELDIVVHRKGDVNSTYLLWNELLDKNNYKYFETSSPTTNNLKYEVTNVEFGEDDVAKKDAHVTVKISHPDLDQIKMYQRVVTKGFWSKAYNELQSEVKTLTNNFIDLTQVAPTITLKKGVTNKDIIDNINNISWLKQNVEISKPSKLTNDVTFTISRVLDLGTSGIEFRLLMSPSIDPNAYITLNDISQEFIAILSSNKNNQVFLDS